MKVLFLVPYPKDSAASQRFRFEQYFATLANHSIQFDHRPFIDNKTWNVLYEKGNYFGKAIGIIKGFLRRIWTVVNSKKYDYVFIHREASPIGPPVFEWILAKILRHRIIYDFDDSIWIKNTSEENKLVSWIKWHSKTSSICRWSYKVSCGNEFLQNYALNYNSKVIINPTTIDTDHYHIPIHRSNSTPVIGWTGTHSTNKYLLEIIPVIKELSESFNFTFRVISNQKPDFSMKNLKFIEWNKNTEIEDLNSIDIGVMPLKDDDWSKGKCGFKALQYMALEIPALVSPVGVNASIVQDNVEGYHCHNLEDWHSKMKYLLENPESITELGKKGRQRVIDHYSVNSNTSNFLSLFD